MNSSYFVDPHFSWLQSVQQSLIKCEDGAEDTSNDSSMLSNTDDTSDTGIFNGTTLLPRKILQATKAQQNDNNTSGDIVRVMEKPDRKSKGSSKAYNKTRTSPPKHRRLQANQRERKRMHGLKEAFDLLREHLPSWANDRKMSKYDTLLMAQTYIVALQSILHRPETSAVQLYDKL